MPMKRHMTTLALAAIFTISVFAVLVHDASAITETIYPKEVVVKAGSASSTDLTLMATNDSQYMTFASNKSGDKNYYEAYQIESESDISTKYFNVTYPHYYMPVEFKDEKIDSSYTSHKKVIRIQDRNSYQWDQLGYYFNQYLFQRKPIHNSSALGIAKGFLEFYFLSEATNGTFMVTFGDSKYARWYNQWNGSMTGKNFGISFGITPIGGAASQFFFQTSWPSPVTRINSSVSYQPNKWYHVKLAFNFNNSWAIRINNVEAYNSSTWTMDSALRMFNTVSMMTAIRTAASTHESHVYYIDAIGLSYALASHNANVSEMTFNADYVPYSDIYSHNNLNDHVANANFAAYFLFDFGTLLNRSVSATLNIRAMYNHLITSGGSIKLFDWKTRSYDNFVSYNRYFFDPAESFTFERYKNGTTIINASRYIDGTGKFAMKIEAESTNSFDFIVDYMVVEFVLAAEMGQVLIVIVAVLGVVSVYILYRIMQRGAPRARAGARRARRNMR